MPRDISGNYTLPVGNPVVGGTVISTSWGNGTLSDIAAQLNNVLTRDGLLGPTSPMVFAPGTAALPSITTTGDANNGVYFPAADQVGISNSGALQALFAGPSGATNFLTFTGSAGGIPAVFPGGAASDISLNVGGKGAGAVQFLSNGATQALVRSSGSSGAHIELIGDSIAPTITAQGPAADISLNVASKGSSNINLFSNGSTQAQISGPAGATRFVQFSGSAAGTPFITAAGAPPNIGLDLFSKGAGNIFFYINGTPQASINGPASAVNRLELNGSVSGIRTTIGSVGADANIGIAYGAKGAGDHAFFTGGFIQAVVLNTASSNRWVQLTGSNGGNPTISPSAGSLNLVNPVTNGFAMGYLDVPRRTSGFARGEALAISAGVTLNTSDMVAGYTFSVYNDSGSAITITQGSGVTLRLAGTTTTGNRTLAARGMATIWCNSGTEAIMSGAGVS